MMGLFARHAFATPVTPSGDAGTRGEDGATDPAGVEPAPGVGCVDRRLFVPHVDDPDVLVQRTVVDGHHVPTTQREDTVDSGLLQRPRSELPSMYRHDFLLTEDYQL